MKNRTIPPIEQVLERIDQGLQLNHDVSLPRDTHTGHITEHGAHIDDLHDLASFVVLEAYEVYEPGDDFATTRDKVAHALLQLSGELATAAAWAAQATPADYTVRCDNCGLQGKEEEVLLVRFPDIPNLLQRLGPGGEVPAGECPNCHCLVYLVHGEGK